VNAGTRRRRSVVELLTAGAPVFGAFEAERSAEGGRQAAADPDIDFVFYDLEEAEWDMAALGAFISALDGAAGAAGPPDVLLRIPPVRLDREAAAIRAAEGLASGARGLILPHVESPEDVREVARVVGTRLWPVHPDGDVLIVAQIESSEAVEGVGPIVATPGVGVVLPGQKDLRHAYGDEAAVQGAVTSVLAAGTAADVPCGVTAGPHDVRARLEQGFRFIIAVGPGAASLGRATATRED
jgi:2-keto-3-deoxy-L-rhamnonate aldolase RhmA